MAQHHRDPGRQAADRSVHGAARQAEAAVRDIITTLEGGEPGSDEAKIADLYASFMDEERSKRLGRTPILPLLAAIDSVADSAGADADAGWLRASGGAGLVALQAEPDPGDPNRYVMFAGQGGLGLPDEEYYRSRSTPRSARSTGHMAASFALAGVEDSDGSGAAGVRS